MASLKSVRNEPRRLHILVYGPPKAGKTKLVGELAEKKKLIWVDLENGYTTLFQLPEEWQERITLVRIPDTRDNPIAQEALLKLLTGRLTRICEEHGKVDCSICAKEGKTFTEIEMNKEGADTVLVVDSVTQWTQSAIYHITKGKPIDYKLEFDDWGNLGKLMDTGLTFIQQARFSVVCISHEAEAELEDGTMRIVPVAGSRNFSRNSAKYFDSVVYASVRNGKHVFGSSTTFMNKIVSGDRLGHALEKEKTPRLLDLFEAVKAPQNPVTAGSPGITALSTLDRLRQKV